MSKSQKHGHSAAKSMKQKGSGGVLVGTYFVFQFRTDAPYPKMDRCAADQSCTYPAVVGQLCRLHWMDGASPYSATRPQSGHSWIRSISKIMEVRALMKFWQQWHERAKFVMSMTGTRGEFHPKAKLSDDEVQQIRKLIAQRYHNCKEIGDMFGVSAATVSLISTGDYRMTGGEDLGWTFEDRSARSKRVAKAKWDKWHIENDDRMRIRNEKVKAMREEGRTWREIERVIGVKYPTLLKQYHEAYNVPMMDHRQAGLKRKRLAEGNQFQPST